MEARDQPASEAFAKPIERRIQARFPIETEIKVHSRTCGTLKGHTVDISESGVAAMLMMEVPVGELVELEFTLSYGRVLVYAMVRQRSAFRYGFQFLDSKQIGDIIRPACRELFMEKSLAGGNISDGNISGRNISRGNPSADIAGHDRRRR